MSRALGLRQSSWGRSGGTAARCILHFMNNPAAVARWLTAAQARLLPPVLYVKQDFKRRVGRPLNLKEPRTFSEKIQWLKLYYRDERLQRYADKVEMKSVVAAKAGPQYVIPTHVVWSDSREIALEGLPSSCIMKATHGSGWNLILGDTVSEDVDKVRAFFAKWLTKDYYMYSKEWAYKGIQPRVLCEPLIVDATGSIPKDFKVFCFGGQPQFIQVDHDRFTRHTRAFYDVHWRRQDFSIGYPMADQMISPPATLDDLLVASRTLSEDFPFVRVDFLAFDDQCFVNELTFYPGNGMEIFSDSMWDVRLGEMLQLPTR